MQQIAANLPDFDWMMALCYLRIQAMLLVLPGFGERTVPVRVRVGIAMALTPLFAQTQGSLPLPASPFEMLAPAAAEMIKGFVAGGLVRLMALALDIAATAIGSTASLAQIMGGTNDAAPHPIGNVLHLAGLAVLFAMGLPMLVVDLIGDSFALWPVGALPDVATVLPAAVAFVTRSFGLAMLLGAPFVLGGFLFQALSGVINKVMPALPVVFIGAPASILLALAAMAALTPLLVGLWADAILSVTLPRP